MGVPPPALSSAPALEPVLAAARNELEGRPVERMLVYLPDAIGTAFYRDYLSDFVLVEDRAPVRIELRSMTPAKTPVCFASMFTGGMPEEHGIRKYERPVLACDTLFDAMARAGKRTALVAVKDSSMDIIFRNRDIDYFTEENDAAVTARANVLIYQNRHDLVVVYHQEYDDCLHRTSHRSTEAMAAFRRHIMSFYVLADTAGLFWRKSDYAVLFAPDHGAHDDGDGRGTHGVLSPTQFLDIPDDMEVTHFWGLHAESRRRIDQLRQLGLDMVSRSKGSSDREQGNRNQPSCPSS
jgi:hypothetical protein